jgi:hypothetical protein
MPAGLLNASFIATAFMVLIFLNRKIPVTNQATMSHEKYKSCIEACQHCVITCINCAAMDLKEEHVNHMTRCIRLDLECAAICQASAQLMTLGSAHAHEHCRLCAKLCTECAEECEKHDNAHCKLCAEACRKCAAECLKM